MNIIPHAYQTRALDAVRRSIGTGHRAPLLVSPTGSGKTVMLGLMAHGHVHRRGGRVVWIAHRDELISQAAETLHGRFGLTVGARGLGESAPVQVISVQSVLARDTAPDATLAIFDEAHHYADAAEEWARVRKAYETVSIVGATATPERGDGAGLSGAFDDLVVACQISELQAMWREDVTRSSGLVPLRVLTPDQKVRAKHIATTPLDAYLRHCPGASAVVFAPHIKAATEFAASFNEVGIRADVVTGKTPKDKRRAMLDAWKAGRVRVICNVQILTEGFDMPSLGVCIVARGVSSDGQLIQMAGRVLRPSPGKTEAILIDLRGVTLDFGRPDADRIFSLDGVGIRLASDPEVTFCKCGAVAGTCDCTAAEQATPKSLGLELQPWQERMRAEHADQRTQRLANWIAQSRAKGHKPGAARFKFRAAYGYFPPRGIWAAAESLVA